MECIKFMATLKKLHWYLNKLHSKIRRIKKERIIGGNYRKDNV